MPILARTLTVTAIYEIFGQLITNPKSLGLREHLPPRVLDALTSMREILREQMAEAAPAGGGDNELTCALTQDADTEHDDSANQEMNSLPFNRLLSRRMAQLHLSNYDVAVSLSLSIQHMRDLINGDRVPTELHVAELALLLGVTQESLGAAPKQKVEAVAATV